MGFPGDEQRQHPRVPLILQVEYPEREGYLADETENLSAGGAFVRTDRELKVGEVVPLKISFPGLLEPVEVVGQVAWVRAAGAERPPGVGVRIPENRVEDRAKLASLIARLEAARAKPAAKGRYRILLVEDNPHVMEMYEYVMKKLARQDQVEIQVDLAVDGHDALGRMAKERYDLVITDLYMPVLDGFQFIEKLRKDPTHSATPVIAISAGGVEAHSQAKRAGANIFLRKPVRFVDVLETVRSLLKL
jgi:uncharacterized protein (TIGR02266 family)